MEFLVLRLDHAAPAAVNSFPVKKWQ